MVEDDYEALPESIKMTYSRAEWMWMSDDQKGLLLQTETEPDYEE